MCASQRVSRLYSASHSASVCVAMCECVLAGGSAMNTLTHTKVNEMTHGDLYVRIPSRSSVRLVLNRRKRGGGVGKEEEARLPVWVSAR